MLQYIEGDYVEAIEAGSASELAEHALLAQQCADLALELDAGGGRFVSRLRGLKEQISTKAPPLTVHEGTGALIADIVRDQHLPQSPRRAPDLKRGKALFNIDCAPCHGAQPGSLTEVALLMKPRPPSFFLSDVMNPLTPWKAFNLVTFGIPETPMPSFAGVDEQDRWALAFYVYTLRFPQCDAPTERVPLEKLATLSDNELVARFGEPELPCLRHQLGTRSKSR